MDHRPLNNKQEKESDMFHVPCSMVRGFTLMEMVVTVGIFALISTVVIVRNAQFDNENLLHNLAYDIALSIREAQQFGVNVRASAGDDFDNAYGIHFNAESPTYIMFRDFNDDGFYNEPEELLETYTLGRGATVSRLCSVGVKDECSLTHLDIVFRRPDPDAVIDNGAIGQATIEIVPARKEGSRILSVESTGQISIKRGVENALQPGE